MRKQRGISLVELMVSITIGLVLMTGVVQLFLSSRASFSTQQAVSRVQETGRLAMEFLGNDIRMAGYMGCMSRNLNFENTLNDSDDLAYNFEIGIEGVDFNGAAADYPARVTDNAVSGTDIIVLRSASGNAVGVADNNNGAQLFAENAGVVDGGCGAAGDSYSGLCEGDILVVTDCSKAKVFQAFGLSETQGGTQINVVHSGNNGQNSAKPGNAVTSWGGQSDHDPDNHFGPDSEIIKMNTTIYYIRTNDAGRRALYQDNGAGSQELLEGIEDMQITYGRDNNLDSIPDSYQTATEVGNNWASISSVRIQLLVASPDDNVLQESQTYTFPTDAPNATEATDRRLRQVFINTIGIRSRLP